MRGREAEDLTRSASIRAARGENLFVGYSLYELAR